MAEYLINLSGSICELLIILFFLKDRYEPKTGKKFLIPIYVGLILSQFANTNLFLMKSEFILCGSFLFVFLTLFTYKIKLIQQIVFTIFLFLANILSAVSIGLFMSLVLDADVSAIQDDFRLFAICTLSSKFLTYFFVLLLRQKKLRKDFSIIRQNIFLVFTLPVSSIMVILLFLRCCYQINDDFFLTITLITSVILAVANVIVFYVMDKQNELIETKERLIFAEKQIEDQIAHYQELYKHQNELRQFRHNIKNRLVSLIGLLKTNQIEKTLQTMENNLIFLNEENKNIINSGNPVIDAMLQSKLNLAKESNIQLHLFIRFESEINIDEIELGIILGNALDNAIEAVNKLSGEEDKYIDLRLITTEDRISIAIKNPVLKNIDVNNLTTTKEDKSIHGLGIHSIKSISAKYDGVVNFECSNKIFSININLSNIKD